MKTRGSKEDNECKGMEGVYWNMSNVLGTVFHLANSYLSATGVFGATETGIARYEPTWTISCNNLGDCVSFFAMNSEESSVFLEAHLPVAGPFS